MANTQHIQWLLEGVEAWNKRREREDFVPDLSGSGYCRQKVWIWRRAYRNDQSPRWEIPRRQTVSECQNSMMQARPHSGIPKPISRCQFGPVPSSLTLGYGTPTSPTPTFPLCESPTKPISPRLAMAILENALIRFLPTSKWPTFPILQS